MKHPLCNITLSLVCLIAFISPLSAAVLSNLSYSQRLGTKLVDIKYDLSLANGEAANIELFFSFDDGKTFPVPCSSLSGDAGPYVLPGRDKRVTWDAGKDWNHKYTSKGNMVAVISNGTAVLGLGDIGPEASKPVMEGKGVLFKKFAGIDVFDLEINCTDTDEFIKVIKALEPTFGGINLEDIKAPEWIILY